MQRNHTLTSHFSDHIATLLKDSLRGVRHIALYVRGKLLSLINILPSFISKPADSVAARVDHIAARVDRRTSKAVHRYLDPDSCEDPHTLTLKRIMGGDDAPYVFAKSTYDSLKIVVPYVSKQFGGEEQYFISELFAACAFHRGVTDLDSHQNKTDCSTNSLHHMKDDKMFRLAGLLTLHLLRQGVIRTRHSTNAASSTDSPINKVAITSCFASMLYLTISREPAVERENYLLLLCCDVSINLLADVIDAKDDAEALSDLLSQNSALI